MIKINFYKFHGAGNDFIMLDNRHLIELNRSSIQAMCARHTGIGADGLILLEPQNGDDFCMRYFNADGNEASFCGNGARCIVAFAHYLKIIDHTCCFMAIDGHHQAEILAHEACNKWTIRLEMKKATPVIVFEDGFFTDTGSPHFVTFCKDVNEVDITTEGKKLRYDTRFSEGANVNFVMPFKDGIFVRTYERGVEAETLSCGTGVTAAAFIFATQQQKLTNQAIITVYTRGGCFQVELTPSQIWLTGDVTLSFCGTIILEDPR